MWLLDDSATVHSHPMMALRSDSRSPAQFVFDLGALGGAIGLHAWVVSGAADWVERGLEATAEAVLQQARSTFPGRFQGPDALRHVRAERRATFACTPGLNRPCLDRPGPGGRRRPCGRQLPRHTGRRRDLRQRGMAHRLGTLTP